MGEFTKVKATTMDEIQMNAGIMVDTFEPTTGAIGNILAATTGGFSFATNPEYEDFGEDIDNMPPNTWQMKRCRSYDPAASGNFVALTGALAKRLSGAGSIEGNKITPSHTLVEADFQDVWIIGDYSSKNEGAAKAGYVAIHIMNALNTAGFQWTSTKDGKGQFAFDFHGHYDLEDIDTVPYEIYVKAGTD